MSTTTFENNTLNVLAAAVANNSENTAIDITDAPGTMVRQADTAPTKTTWKDGDVITHAKIQNTEDNAYNAYVLSQSNEHDIDDIDHIIEAIATDADTDVKLVDGIVKTDAIADGAVSHTKLAAGSVKNANIASDAKITADKLSLGNGVTANATTKMLEVPIDTDHLSYGSSGIGIKAGGIGHDELANGAIYSTTGNNKLIFGAPQAVIDDRATRVDMNDYLTPGVYDLILEKLAEDKNVPTEVSGSLYGVFSHGRCP